MIGTGNEPPNDLHLNVCKVYLNTFNKTDKSETLRCIEENKKKTLQSLFACEAPKNLRNFVSLSTSPSWQKVKLTLHEHLSSVLALAGNRNTSLVRHSRIQKQRHMNRQFENCK